MNIRDLKYLVTVADTKHFGKAAELCFVSQPTLSMQLKKLEDELSVKIFERNNKNVFITPAGEKIVAKAREIVIHCDELKQLAQNVQDPFSGEMRLGIIPTLGPYLLPKIIKLSKQHFPKLTIIVEENKTESIMQKLRDGILDFAVLALPIAHENLVEKKLFNEPFYVAFSNKHPLSKKEKIKLNDIKDENLLLLAEGHCLRDQALEVCAFIGKHKNNGYSATSLETLRHMVASGAGITLLPELSVHASKYNPNLVIKPFVKPQPSREIGLLYRKGSVRTECLEELSKLLKI